jgi:hypothetical protein
MALPLLLPFRYVHNSSSPCMPAPALTTPAHLLHLYRRRPTLWGHSHTRTDCFILHFCEESHGRQRAPSGAHLAANHVVTTLHTTAQSPRSH